tara:strand:- start:2205 stop:2684 length:480 start_codon:yes stop_codon:yes gene_type:complete
MTQQYPTGINPKTGKEYYYKDNPEAVAKRKARQMYVNGKYIPMSHPLHKAGRYNNFNDAAFLSLQKDIKVKEGYVYAISNPAWPEWVKIGMAVDAEDRLNAYQTGSPSRDYVLIHSIPSKDRSKTEREAHNIASTNNTRSGEWFKISNKDVINILDSLV